MTPREFFKAVFKMRQEQKRIKTQQFVNLMDRINLELESEKVVDAEFERVEELFINNNKDIFWK